MLSETCETGFRTCNCWRVKNMKKQTLLPNEWLDREHPDAAARQAYVDRHLLGGVPEGLDRFDGFYEARRKALEGKIRALLGGD